MLVLRLANLALSFSRFSLCKVYYLRSFFQQKQVVFLTLLHVMPIQTCHRAIGLEILGLACQLKKPNARPEARKQVIRKSFWLALCKCGVHFLPAAASITLLYINIKGYWIGTQMVGMNGQNNVSIALLQLTAKMQELLIIASLATALFDILRFELLYGCGVPLGLLGSGITFTQISYFWSPDFLGALRYGPPEKKKRFRLCIALLVAGFLAITAGPASAMLMIPRHQAWAADNFNFYLNGTEDDFWPSPLTYEDRVRDWGISNCRGSTATRTAVFPAGGYHLLWAHFTASTIHDVNNVVYDVNNLESKQSKVDIDSPLEHVPTHTVSGNIRGLTKETWMLTTHAATDRLQKLLTDVWQAVMFQMSTNIRNDRSRYHLFSTSTSAVHTRIPVVRVACAPAQNLSEGQMTLELSVVPAFDYWDNTANLSLPDILPNARRQDHARLTWLETPAALGITTAGALVELPWDNHTSTRVAFGCSIDARWTLGVTSYDGQAPHDANIGHTRPRGVDKEFLPDSSHWKSIRVDGD